MMPVLLTIAALSAGFAEGWYCAIRHCARQNRCIVKQASEVEDWTGELTREMQAKLSRRERGRARISKDSGT